jgi:transcriptional regulator with XRE-family HTH domain
MPITNLPHDLAPTLSKLRCEAKVSQKEIAGKLRIDQSRVSRIESGEANPDSDEIKAFLDGLGTPEASAYLAYLQRKWQVLDRPPLNNPNHDAIWRAEKTLQRLSAFEMERNPPAAVRGELLMHRESLRDAAKFLAKTDHQLAFMGEAGVGKTTALGLIADLVLSDSTLTLDKRLLLETGKGRITLCEVHVRTGQAWGLQIEPTPEPEIYRLVSELCANVSGERPSAEGEQTGIPRELDRALRNMAGVPRSVKKRDGKPAIHDPLAELRNSFNSADELASEFASRLKLWKRTTRDIWCPTMEADARKWLREIFAKVNKGQLEDISLPARIDVVVPHGLLDQNMFDITLIDTRGVDETVVRPDLRLRITDNRTLTILCSEFKAAPDNTVKQVLEHLFKAGGDRAIGERLVLLVLAHPGQAQGVTDDIGQPVESDTDGYELKQDQIGAALTSLGASGVPVLMFNAVSEDPLALGRKLIGLIESLRTRYVHRIEALGNAVTQLMKNYEEHAAKLIRADVNKQLGISLERHEALPPLREQAHDFLLSQLANVHASTVWATTRRQGGWYNLDVYHCLGVGVAREGNRRSAQFFAGLEEVVNNMLANAELAVAHPFLQEVLVKLSEWKDAFLEAAHQAGAEAFRPALQADTELWAQAQAEWGRGGGYRDDVARFFRTWFLADEREGLHRALERRVKTLWRSGVIEPLQAICASAAVSKSTKSTFVENSHVAEKNASTLVQ